MRTFAAHVARSLCVSVGHVHELDKTAELIDIDMPFGGGQIRVKPRNIVSDGMHIGAI